MAGAPISYWIAFHVFVVVLLVFDLGFLQHRPGAGSQKVAWWWTAFLTFLATVFAFMVFLWQGHVPAMEFASGYLIELSLSVDNLFVFLIMFRSVGLTQAQQHRVLFWGILGAVIMRAFFILAGVSLLARFHWIQYVFGAVLLIAGIRLLRPKGEDETPSKLMRWMQHHAMGGIDHPQAHTGGMAARTLFVVILAVELTDLVFALDSIPAVLAVTRRPFIVYTSNIFAILGLRSLFFALSGLLDRLRLLHYGLAIILIFVALKMITSHYIEIPVSISLGVILGILAIFTVASLRKAGPTARTAHK
jgi:tellurite resistance protein TerC